MNTKTLRASLAALLVLVASPAAFAIPAAPASPADVTVEVSGASAPVLPQTAVRTTTASVIKDATPAHACTGTSAAGALEVATAGAWSGPYFNGLGYAAEVIKGEKHRFPSPPGDPSGDGNYWAFYLNGRVQNVGLCGTELQTGDRVQLWPACGGAPNATCTDEPVQLSAPAVVAPGASFTVSVTESSTTYDPITFDATSTVAPSSGASVGGQLTGADGRATLSLTERGPHLLTAAKGNRARSSATVCVTDGSDGSCGTSVPAPVGPCVSNGHDGRCGSVDRTPAAGRILAIREQERFVRSKAPRTLQGSVAVDPSGLRAVQVRLTRNDRGRCSAYDAKRERFAKLKRCGAAHGTYFTIGDRADWSYLLPAPLSRGRYVLDVRTVDAAGNVDDTLQRGRNRIVFFVA